MNDLRVDPGVHTEDLYGIGLPTHPPPAYVTLIPMQSTARLGIPLKARDARVEEDRYIIDLVLLPGRRFEACHCRREEDY